MRVAEEVLASLSKDVKCKEEKLEDGVYLICRDKDGNIVYKKKIMEIGGTQ